MENGKNQQNLAFLTEKQNSVLDRIWTKNGQMTNWSPEKKLWILSRSLALP